MQKNIQDQNRGEVIVSISGSNRGVHLLLIGEKSQIVRMLKNAIKTNSELKEIFRDLTLSESGQEKSQDQNQKSLNI